MFKKLLMSVVVLAALWLGVTGVVFAQNPTPRFDGACPYGGACGGAGMGGHMMGGYGYQGALPELLAEALDMTVDELVAALSDGQTVAELAEAQGLDLADVAAAVVAPHVERVQQAVADGYLTQEQADWMIEEMTEHMAYRLENFGLGQGGFGGGGCGMTGGGSFGNSRGSTRGGMMGGRGGGDNSAPRWSAPAPTS